MDFRWRKEGWSGPSAKGMNILAWDSYWKATQWGPGPLFGPNVVLLPLTTFTPPPLCAPRRSPVSNVLLALCRALAQAVSSARIALSYILSINNSSLKSPLKCHLPCEAFLDFLFVQQKATAGLLKKKKKKRSEISGEILHQPSLTPTPIFSFLIPFPTFS